MSGEKKIQGFSDYESLIMQGLASKIAVLFAQGNTNTPILDIALQTNAEALNELDPGRKTNPQYLAAYDRIIEIMKETPDKTVADFIKEHPPSSPTSTRKIDS